VEPQGGVLRLARVAALVLAAGAAGAETPVRVAIEDGAVRASPAPPGAGLRVFVAGPGELPPLLGATQRQGEALVFRPRYPLAPGMRFRVVYRGAPDAPAEEIWLETPAPAPRAPTEVEAIYPSSSRLPENLLKLYLQFSAPMSRGEAWQRLRLIDAGGIPVEHPFLEIAQELWDPRGRRLTVLFDPGRVKRELRPHVEEGSPLREGAEYVLEVDAGWPDAAGRPLAAKAFKRFAVGPADHAPPSMGSWEIEAPAAGTRDALQVRFPEPLDRALLESALGVDAASGQPLPGRIEVSEEERLWRFVPERAWVAGGHALRAASLLEDLAGNSLGRPFEVDVFERVEERVLEVREARRFEVR
jgi:hypothetical protein